MTIYCKNTLQRTSFFSQKKKVMLNVTLRSMSVVYKLCVCGNKKNAKGIKKTISKLVHTNSS